MRKVLIIICMLALSVVLISCSESNQKDSTSEQQTYTGYLSVEGNTLSIDEFELITSENHERMQQLGITEADMPNGYFIHNESEELKSFTVDKNTEYTFYDTSNLFVKEEDDKKYTTTDKQQFETFLYRGKEAPMLTPFEIVTQGNKVLTVKEIFMN